MVNNQIGFTTAPTSGRSSVYSTDVAKINQVPIFHVNGDDPEAAYRVLQIALDYRHEFHKDLVIDLIGFRRHGHNEGDEPSYTQPLMYRRIQEHPGVRALYARRLVREGVLTEAEAAEMEERQRALYEQAQAAAKEIAARRKEEPGERRSGSRARPGRHGDGSHRRAGRGPGPDRTRDHDRAGRLPPQPQDRQPARAPRAAWPKALSRSTGPRRRGSPSGRSWSRGRRCV